MKIFLFVLSIIFQNSALGVTRLEFVSSYKFKFINWSLVTKIVPLRNGNNIVQKYGTTLTLLSASGEELKEVLVGEMSPLYQSGTQLNDGRILFHHDDSLATLFDENLNKISEFRVPSSYINRTCSLNNEVLVFSSYNRGEILFMDKQGAFNRVAGLGGEITNLFCLPGNRAFVVSDQKKLFTIIDFNYESQVIFQKNFNFIPDSVKISGGKAKFYTSQGLVVLDLETFSEDRFSIGEVKPFTGIDYFSNGDFVTIEAKKSENIYHSEINVYTANGVRIASQTEATTGASIVMPIMVIQDEFILTHHCSPQIILYDKNLSELSRLDATRSLYSPIISLHDGSFASIGFDHDLNFIFQFKISH